ncbi:MAG: hypothetical protein QE271_00730 [Bacteriovoracaceae bacterium]|nr:hypothetical protein [Bacteriovoracaceae bacterium]
METKLNSQHGQAVIEYLFVIMFIIFFSFNLTLMVRDLFQTNFASFAHILSKNLSSGVCPKICLYDQYENGHKN